MAPKAMTSLNVIVPPGMKPGQELQAQSPDGTIVQAKIPAGMKPGQTFTMQYTPTVAPTPPEPKLLGALGKMYSGGDLLVLLGLVAVGFSLPYLFSHAGSVLPIVATYAIPAAIAFVAIAYDWTMKGPTVALKHGLASAAVAWVMVVPLGLITHSLLHYLSALIIAGVAISMVLTLLTMYGIIGCIVGVLLGMVLVHFGSFMVWLITEPFGTSIVFAATFWCARMFFSVLLQHHLDPKSWPDVSEVDKDSEEFKTQKEYFLSSCQPWSHKYDFDLQVAKVFRIEKPVVASSPSGSRSAAASRRLFHGTPWEAAMGIVCDGFRLPNHSGMFGKGIYFADCPLKSWRYCFSSKQMADSLPRILGRGGYILMCWVDLGTRREEKEAKPELKGYNRRGWMAWLTGQRGAYDSVVGMTEEEGGALRVPEYIVYDTSQVRLAYLFEVFKHERGTAQQSNSNQA
ncbi:Parp2 [Symbiodinium sp. CCMP2592]|nr:Parp2 [Symbiodinium sp. CCMP2592]